MSSRKQDDRARGDKRPTGNAGTPPRFVSQWLAVVGAVALSLSGCNTFKNYIHNGFKVGPNYGRPPAPIADDWIDADDVRIRKQADDLSSWWTVFNDPTLTSLIETAYPQNLTLREAGFRVLEARAELGIAIGNFFPQTQDMSGGYVRNALSGAVANRQFIPTRFYDQWTNGFDLAWELDFWGRFRRAIEAADADLDAFVENYDDVLVTLLGDVAATYTQMRTVEKQIELAKANIALQAETLKIAQARFQGGTATELDVDQAKSILAQTEALVPQLEIQLRQLNNALCVLLGIPPEDLMKRMGPGRIPVAPVDVAAGMPAELLSRRPDVRRAERQAAAQCARIGVAVSELYPHIAITGTIGYTAQSLANLYTPLAFRGTIGPSFQWNLLNYGRLINNVRLQDARFQERIASYQNTVLKAGQEVENGLVLFLRSQVQAKFLAESVDAAERAVKVSIAQYKGGLVDFNRVSLLEQNLVQQQNLLAQAQGEIAVGLIQTYKALGGGWQIRLGAEGDLMYGPPAPSDAPTMPEGSTPTPAPSTTPSDPRPIVPLPQPTPDPKPAPQAKPAVKTTIPQAKVVQPKTDVIKVKSS